MSFKVLVIPEDPTWNGYILKPLATALLDDAGKPNAKVKLLENPHVGGYDQALSAIRGELPDLYGFFDLWLFFPDADRASADAMDNLETELQARDIPLLCCGRRLRTATGSVVAAMSSAMRTGGREPSENP